VVITVHDITPLTQSNQPFSKIQNIPVHRSLTHLSFFVKGGAQITVILGNHIFTDHQTYGSSYELFSLNFNKDLTERLRDVGIVISPKIENEPVSLIGPFWTERMPVVEF